MSLIESSDNMKLLETTIFNQYLASLDKLDLIEKVFKYHNLESGNKTDFRKTSISTKYLSFNYHTNIYNLWSDSFA